MYSVGVLCLFVFWGRCGWDLRWVNSTNHTIVAVLALGAVEPYWITVLYGDGESFVRLSCYDGDETGEETVSEWGTWFVEGALSNIVVLGEEVECNDIADGCFGGGRCKV